MENQFIDLSHTIEEGLITYKGLPAPVVCDFLSREEAREFYDDDSEFQIDKIEMVANTGTYVDCPFHRFKDGKDLSQVGLERFAELDGIVIRAPHTESLEIGLKHFEGQDIEGKAVLVHTSWDKFWNTKDYYENHPYLTKEAAEFLTESQVKLVGIDSHNIDNTQINTRPVHTTLLGNEILIVEHLCNLESLPATGFYFSAVPPKFKGVGSFPVRAMARIKQSKQLSH